MKISGIFQFGAALLLTGLLVVLSISGPAGACSYVRAYAISTCTFVQGDYIAIGTQSGDGSHTCEGEVLHTKYNATKTDGCGGSTVCTFQIEGNGLSGTYQVDQVSNGCLNLCVCTPQG